MLLRTLYSLVWWLLTPFILLRLWWKGRRLKAYRGRIAERFSLGRFPQPSIDIWVHAVSLGEVIAAIPLVEKLLQHQQHVLITTMTPTGAERVQAHFKDRVLHRYLPYELSFAQRRFFRYFKPRLAIIFETELWPNVIYHADKAGILLYLFNARLSERSCKGYARIKPVVADMLRRFAGIHAQSEDDAKRFISLGAPKQKTFVTGNIKFDINRNHSVSADYQRLKTKAGPTRPTIILASTHEDEESQLLAQYKKLKHAIPNLLILIAPRHPERFETVFELTQRLGLNSARRSQLETVSAENEVIVLDSLGELLSAYQISDIAFVGGSLVPVGGHNVLEPIAMQVPVISGSMVHNFKSIIRDLLTANAITVAENAGEVINQIIYLYHHPKAAKQLTEKAQGVLAANRGALERYFDVVWAQLHCR